jgi:hypothetical protein
MPSAKASKPKERSLRRERTIRSRERFFRTYIGLSLLTISCRHEWGSEPAEPAPTAVRPDEYGPPEPTYLPTIDAICNKAPCSGELAQVTAWYDHKNRIQAYVHDGDIQRCSSKSSTIYDRDANAIRALKQGLVKGGTQSCRKQP